MHPKSTISSSILTLLIALSIVLPVGAVAPRGDSEDAVVGADSGFAVAIHAAGDYAGDLDPCGCHIPLGGLARRAGYANLVAERFSDAPPVLQLDAGHLFMSVSSKEEPIRASAEIRNEWALRAGDLIKLAAANASAYDLTFLTKMRKEDGYAERVKSFPMLERFVSANVTPVDATVHPFAPYRVVEVKSSRLGSKSLRVGIFGVAEAPKGANVVGGYSIGDPIAAIQKYLPEVRRASDVVVLLAYADKGLMRRIQNAAPGVDLIISANQLGRPDEAENLELPVVSTVANEAKYLTELRLRFDPAAKLVAVDRRVITLDDRIADDRAALRLAYEARQAAEAKLKTP
jgi:2',3'-cyclic-nucleotide 2'-phosphodiesterase (5'-nucleotidase family)